MKQNNPKLDTTIYEDEIDKIIYNAYKLTNKEIAVIEKQINGV